MPPVNNINNLSLVHVKSACDNCRVRELCLPTTLSGVELSQLDGLVKRLPPLQKGQNLYRTGDNFKSIYAIQHGAIKTYGITVDGREQITGFHLSGEIVGLDAIDSNQHPCNAVALEETEVCEIPFAKLESLSQKIPGLLHNISRIMSREILREENVLMMLGGASAEQRLARFLLSLHKRLSIRQTEQADCFQLCMSRQDISNYLGLALETVSRQLTHLHDINVINIQNRKIQILALDTLQSLAV